MAKGKQMGLFPGNEDKVGYWLTPPELMKLLEEEFHFTFDSCPYPRPSGFNGLLEDWGASTWCNPPLGKGSSISAWVNKALLESKRGHQVVLVLPMPRWVRDLLRGGAEVRPLGAVPWMNPEGKRTTSDGGGHYPDTLFILKAGCNQKERLDSRGWRDYYMNGIVKEEVAVTQ
jgi:hypothetical protein